MSYLYGNSSPLGVQLYFELHVHIIKFPSSQSLSREQSIKTQYTKRIFHDGTKAEQISFLSGKNTMLNK